MAHVTRRIVLATTLAAALFQPAASAEEGFSCLWRKPETGEAC